uniref:Uncharacterized protein n=1 Tax=Rhipicephalus zambeziensis TaxID=60191 RepID=A0A224YEU3_9ACAR
MPKRRKIVKKKLKPTLKFSEDWCEQHSDEANGFSLSYLSERKAKLVILDRKKFEKYCTGKEDEDIDEDDELEEEVDHEEVEIVLTIVDGDERNALGQKLKEVVLQAYYKAWGLLKKFVSWLIAEALK